MDATPPTPRLTCTVAEAAEMLGISPALAYRMARADELPTVRIRRRVLIRVEALRELVNAGGTIGDGA